MNIEKAFEEALTNLEFESSDTKLETWKRLKHNHEFYEIALLIMDFSYELGMQDNDE